ncbi:MAG: Fic family protein [Chloroflexi bacterium]|nr:Fic family protein [Chloroflexota bacterium]
MQMAADTDNTPKIFHKWKPIEPIDSASQAYDFGEIDSLQREWLRIKQEVESSNTNAYKAFTDRLTRRWSIETGIIEGIYDLDSGVTETLIERGIATEYISRGSTNKEPAELVQVLKDHQESVASVNYWIEQRRPLSKTFILSLHSQILRSQDTHTAVNQFGQRFEATLNRGEFKNQPNNPTRSDGTVHEYCPPEQVESELDSLLSMYEGYDSEGCHPLILAAWLHHRFTQIHPFADGNGRVGRAILTWHLVKNRYFPIVISRDDRTEYIDALEQADAGNLKHLISLFVNLEKTVVVQALAPSDLVDEVIDSIVERAGLRQASESHQMSRVNEVAVKLQESAEFYLSEKAQNIQNKLVEVNLFVSPDVRAGHTSGHYFHQYNAHMHEISKKLQYSVNFNEYIYTIELDLETHNVGLAPRMLFVISLFHIGHTSHSTGVMAATAFAEMQGPIPYSSQRHPELITSSIGNAPFYNCTVAPFTFTWNDSAEEVSPRFINWTEACLSIALRYWMENSDASP